MELYSVLFCTEQRGPSKQRIDFANLARDRPQLRTSHPSPTPRRASDASPSVSNGTNQAGAPRWCRQRYGLNWWASPAKAQRLEEAQTSSGGPWRAALGQSMLFATSVRRGGEWLSFSRCSIHCHHHFSSLMLVAARSPALLQLLLPPSTAPPPVAMDALRVRSTSMSWSCASCHRPSSNSTPRNHPSISEASPNQAGAPRMVPPALRGVDASQRPWVYPMQAGKPPCRPRWSFR